MARLSIEDFDGQELTRVYLAGRVNEAERVEGTLTEHGVNYAVDIEPFVRRVLGVFTSEYRRVAFYVPSGQAASARSLLEAARLTEGLSEDESPD